MGMVSCFELIEALELFTITGRRAAAVANS